MVIIQGSHRKSGNSGAVALLLEGSLEGTTMHLADYKIDHFDYAGPGNDDFRDMIMELVQHREIIFVTPIYWYTMSGRTKVFLDRISDLLKWDKELGRQLRGIKMHVVSVSGHDDAAPYFQEPFLLSASYLGMKYGDYFHAWGNEGHLTEESKNRAEVFIAARLEERNRS